MSNTKRFITYWATSIVSGLMIWKGLAMGRPDLAWVAVPLFILSLIGIVSIALTPGGVWGKEQTP